MAERYNRHTYPKEIVLHGTFPWWSSSCKKSNRLVDSLQIYWWSESCSLIEWEAQLATPKIVSLRCCLPLMTNSMQKTRISLDSFQRYWWSKNPTIWLDKRHNWPRSPKRARPGCCIPFLIISLQKSIDCWISSRHIDDQKFLKSNLTRDKTGHTEPKVPFFDDYLSIPFFDDYLSINISKISIYSFQRYCNLIVWEQFRPSLKNKIFPRHWILQNHKEHCHASFLG